MAGPKRHQILTGLTFAMISRVDGTAITTGDVHAYISKDGNTQVGLQYNYDNVEHAGVATHLGGGQYKVDITADEMDAAVVGLLFTHATGVPVEITLITDSNVDQTGDSYTRIGAAGAGLTDITTPLSALGDAVALCAKPSDTIARVTTVDSVSSPSAADIAAAILANPTNKLVTDASGRVDVGAISGSPSYVAASAFSPTIYDSENGTSYSDADTSNGIYHEVVYDADTQVLDCNYTFGLAVDEVAAALVFKGRLGGTGGTVACQAWSFTDNQWFTLFSLVATAGTADTNQNPALVSKYTGPITVDVKPVMIRFYGTGLSAATLYVDQLIVGRTVTNRSVGYSEGAIHVDENDGVAGTFPYVNGTADYPTDWASASVLADSGTVLGKIKSFKIAAGSELEQTQGSDLIGKTIYGAGYKLDFLYDSQLGDPTDISYTTIRGCELLTGTVTANSHECFLWDCQIGDLTVGEADIHNCHLTGTLQITTSNPFLLHRCVGVKVTGNYPTIQFQNGGDTSVMMGACSGGFIIFNMVDTDNLYIDGDCDIAINGCTGGSIVINGNIRVTDNSSGAVTIIYNRTNVGSVLDTDLTEANPGEMAYAVSKFFEGSEVKLVDVAETLPIGHAAATSGGLPILSTLDGDLCVPAMTSTAKLLASSEQQDATLTAVNSITRNTARSMPVIAPYLLRPSADYIDYTVELHLYNLAGQSEDADGSTVYITAGTTAGGEDMLSSTTMTKIATGVYRTTYTVSSTHPTGAIYFGFTWPKTETIDGTETLYTGNDAVVVQVQDADTLDNLVITIGDMQTDYMRRSTAADIPGQAIRDAMKLAPSVGDPEAGSLDAQLAGITSTVEDDPDITITVNDTAGNPISGVSVWITSDVAGTTIVKTAVLTDTGGRAVFSNLDSGTYYVWRTKTGRVFVNPQALSVD